MLQSTIFQSTIPTSFILSDHHEIFLTIYENIQLLQSKRIVERLARPIQYKDKMLMMNEVNMILQQIKQLLSQIKQKSADFKGKDTSIFNQKCITSHTWKNGIRRVQIKITHFYEEKMRYFDKVNQSMKLDLELVDLKEKQWARSCISKMRPFCFCG